MEATQARINAEKKTVLGKKSTARRRLASVVQSIEARRGRYRCMLAAMGTASADGDVVDESAFSAVEHRIRLAREKLELREAADRLDERVRKLEAETVAMENTLHSLHAVNDCYASSLSSVNPISELAGGRGWNCRSVLSVARTRGDADEKHNDWNRKKFWESKKS